MGERLRKKIIGKPYSGKPNVRFDEAELEIEPSATTPALYPTVNHTPFARCVGTPSFYLREVYFHLRWLRIILLSTHRYPVSEISDLGVYR